MVPSEGRNVQSLTLKSPTSSLIKLKDKSSRLSHGFKMKTSELPIYPKTTLLPKINKKNARNIKWPCPTKIASVPNKKTQRLQIHLLGVDLGFLRAAIRIFPLHRESLVAHLGHLLTARRFFFFLLQNGWVFQSLFGSI